ncbi:alkaline phosphatase D family protein [Singulisphaera acidiphila]|uniref:Phosphodiesterase/alkaline phosphatase D n=1 Tax=Singulisphaera acidiphila (strain ATCC BAA-1392 / DSM 18658 / VKM B-2454 / MOB10) TaxID=886293 RepID=L0D9G2_SINAD|nr:alkaline phosphatase D family protein [Singulisphaera acidiphila]AGA25296.1 phosphodiesterase/alkaline phosphatase D [Singulisphaera acidiphila DSM 18658]
MSDLDLSAIHEFARREGGFSRRTFLAYSAALSALPGLAERSQGAVLRRATFAGNPFSLGVASGDPTSTGVVLWTRLAPEPLVPGGGLSPVAIEVQWEIADDEAMTKVVRQGTALATPQLGHSVHVEADGLKPDRWYWYRFRAGDAESPTARTRTLPTPAAQPDRLRFAFASCQHYETGLFTAYEHMVKDDLDLILHLGDYIYEDGGRPGHVRQHLGKEIESLDDYRIRYAQYKSDPLLQAAHARCPWLVTWDDHEVDNNYAGSVSAVKGVDSLALLARRANAYQAYYETMPLRRPSLPRGPHMRLYRKASFGRLAELLILDTRQYRSDQPNGDKPADLNAEALDPKQTMLGERQAGWLQASLLTSPATWNVLAQQVMMALVKRKRTAESLYSMDQWPGYAAERIRLVKFLAERRVPNPVVLTGDIHSNWVNDLRVDDRNPETPIVATEFVGTSISSGGNGTSTPKGLETLRDENPCVRFFDAQRGYVRCTVTPGTWRTDLVQVEDISRPGAPAIERASFVVEAGKPGAQSA